MTGSERPSSAKLIIGDKEIELPVTYDTIGDAAIVNISRLFQEQGVMMLDPGYTSTASCSSSITYIDGDKGILLYRGYPIEQLAEKGSYLETAYLLLNGELPNAVELAAFKKDIISRMPVDDRILEIIRAHRRDMPPMDLLASVIPEFCKYYGCPRDEKGRYSAENCREVALNLIAKMPTVIAAAYRYRQDENLPFIEPDPNLDYTENFLRMCFADANGNYTQDPVITKALDRIFVLHADHEQNASTSTVRQVESTGAGPYASFTAGILALSGHSHGGANEDVLTMLQEIGCVENVSLFIARVKNKANNVKLMGFGHRVYKTFDPRAKIIKADCDKVLVELGVTNPLLNVAKELERVALSDSFFIDGHHYPNVDFYSGIILSAMGFEPRIFTPLFALARTSGWISQWIEMVEKGKVVISRPRQNYIGKPQRDYVPITERAPSNPHRNAHGEGINLPKNALNLASDKTL